MIGARVDKEKLAGWVPHGNRRDDRTALSTEDDKSIFPLDNYELIYGDWERKIIWDWENMDYLPKPRDFKVNPNDEKLILHIPDDPEPRVELKAKETKVSFESLAKTKVWTRDPRTKTEDPEILKLSDRTRAHKIEGPALECQILKICSPARKILRP